MAVWGVRNLASEAPHFGQALRALRGIKRTINSKAATAAPENKTARVITHQAFPDLRSSSDSGELPVRHELIQREAERFVTGELKGGVIDVAWHILPAPLFALTACH